MEFLPSKKLSHADGLYRLIPKFSEPLEDTMIAAIKAKNETKNVLRGAIRELLITLDEIRLTSQNDDFMLKMKDQITSKVKNRKGNKNNTFSICDGVMMHADSCNSNIIAKTLIKAIPHWSTGNF